MGAFLERYGAMVLGVLNGFDRLVLRGILRPLSVLAGMRYFLWKKGVRVRREAATGGQSW